MLGLRPHPMNTSSYRFDYTANPRCPQCNRRTPDAYRTTRHAFMCGGHYAYVSLGIGVGERRFRACRTGLWVSAPVEHAEVC